MKLTIQDGNASEVFFNGKYYPAKREIDVPFSEALRLQKNCKCDMKSITPEPYDPVVFHEKHNVSMIADIDTESGWGNVGLNLIKYSAEYFDTSLIGRLNRIDDPRVLAAAEREIMPNSAVIIHEQPKEEWKSLPFARKIAIVPFETTLIPQSWVSRINACNAIIVPCRQNVDMMKDSGVTIPIEIFHWGIDPQKFRKIERPVRDTFTFGIMGSLTKRKGIDILVDAFFKEFPNEKDVRLLCKTSNNFFLWGVKDKRMKIDMTPVSYEELMQGFFKEIDCFVIPTRGEGACIPIIESQATGVPVISTGWSGGLDYMTEETGWFIDYTLEEAVDFTKNVYKEFCGSWAKPSIDHLRKLMRFAYENRDVVKAKGEKAHEYVMSNRTWDKTILGYVDVLKKYL